MPEINQSFNIGLNSEQIKYFQMKVWKALRTRSLADQLAAEDGSNVVHRVTELKKTTWGYEAKLTLVPDDTTFGVVGDNQLEDHEVGITQHQQTVTFDQFRKGHKNEGRMADRSSWVDFAQQASDQLSYWAVDMKNKLMMNTLAGIYYKYELDGSLRDSHLPQLRFSEDVNAPSTNRHFRWDVDATNGDELKAGNTSAIVATDLPTWNMFVDMRTELPLMRVKPVRGEWGNGQDLYICLVHPRTMGWLKKDATFQNNWRLAMSRGDGHIMFKGAETYLVDGILLISHRYVPTTQGAAATAKWGAGGLVDGTRTLFLGAQALGMVEMDNPIWETQDADYKNRHSISLAIKFGFKKTVWPDQYSGTDEDFGVVAVDHALAPGATSYTM
jgi:N4-gp56 family major capsid protein